MEYFFPRNHGRKSREAPERWARLEKRGLSRLRAVDWAGPDQWPIIYAFAGTPDDNFEN